MGNYCEFGKLCPECGKYSALLRYTEKTMIIDGEEVLPITLRCSSCGWELPKEEVIRSYRESRDSVIVGGD